MVNAESDVEEQLFLYAQVYFSACKAFSLFNPHISFKIWHKHHSFQKAFSVTSTFSTTCTSHPQAELLASFFVLQGILCITVSLHLLCCIVLIKLCVFSLNGSSLKAKIVLTCFCRLSGQHRAQYIDIRRQAFVVGRLITPSKDV